jgi:hypothetical protein
MSIRDIMEAALFLLPLVVVPIVLLAVLKNVRPGRKGKYRYSFFERKSSLPR